MAHILAYTSPGRGHLFPLTAILDELRRRGHHISLRTLADEVPSMQARGFKAQPISAQVEALAMDDWHAGNPSKALERAVRTFGARAKYDAPDLREAIAEGHPDALIVDINSWGALATAESWGGPWAAFCPYPLALHSSDAPPFGPGLPPARGSLGRLRDRLLGPLVFGMIEKAMLPGLNGVRSGLNLSPLREVNDLFRRLPLLLYLTAEPFEYPRSDWPPNVVMVGPCAWDPPADPPAWLTAIPQPLVLVTTSSEFQNDGRLIQTAFEALAGEPVVVVATLPAGEPQSFHVPANAHLERFVPHGGMGATQKALARGVPVCVVPFGRDQLEVARRVEVAGAGTRLAARYLSPDRLRAKVRTAMTMTAGAQRVAEGFAAAGGPTAAADAFEARLLTPKGNV